MSETPKFTPEPWKFTPGPWVARPDLSSRESWAIITNDPDDEFHLRICAKASEANARLMAAGPELFAALEMVRDADEDCKRDGLPTMPEFVRARIDAAIAKAEGRT